MLTTIQKDVTIPTLCVRGTGSHDEHLCLRCEAEDLEGEPLHQPRAFAFTQPRSSVLCYLEQDGWEPIYIGPTQCTVPGPVGRVAQSLGLGQTCHTVGLLGHPTRKLVRMGKLRPINEPVYGWVRPMQYYREAWHNVLEELNLNQARSLYEPVLEIRRDTQKSTLACEALDRETGKRRWERFVVEFEQGDAMPHRFLPLCRVTYVGSVTHWPIASERQAMRRRYHQQYWLVRAVLGKAVLVFRVAVWLETTFGIEPITYFNFRG
ncbi:MAG: hypothetical protein U0517_00470 [Candidatus Andersenbacteria bacterium]